MNRSLTSMTLFLAALIVGILIVLFTLVIPTVREVQSMRQNLLAEQQQLEKRYQQGLLLKRLHDDWEKIQEEAEGVNTSVLSYKDSVLFISRLETMAEEDDVTHRLTLALPEEKTKTGQTSSVPFEFQWQGGWTALLKMLVAVEREPYYLPITTIRAVSSRQGSAIRAPIARTPPSLPREALKQNDFITMTLAGETLWKNE